MKNVKKLANKGKQAVNNGVDASKAAYQSAATATQQTVQSVATVAKTAKEVVHVSAAATVIVLEKAAIPLLKFTADMTAPKPETVNAAAVDPATLAAAKPSA